MKACIDQSLTMVPAPYKYPINLRLINKLQIKAQAAPAGTRSLQLLAIKTNNMTNWPS
jgi:hypothetical protein